MTTVRWTAATLLAGLTAVAAQAGDTWDGGGVDNDWSTANNWNPNGIPLNNGTANLIFGGTTRLSPNLDINWSISSITFNNTAGGFSIGGPGDLTIGVSGITNNDTQTQTIGVDRINLSANQTWSASSGDLTVNIGANDFNTSTFTLTITGDFDTTINGPGSFVGSGNLIKNGTGVFLLNAGVFPGDVTINAGILRLGASGDFSSNGVVTVNASGDLDMNGTFEGFGQLLGIGDVTNNNGTLQVGQGNFSSTLNVDITGAGLVEKIGTGTVTLGASFTNTCPNLDVELGTLILNGRISTTAIAVSVGPTDPNAVIDLGTADATFGSLDGAGDVLLNANTLTLGGNNASTTLTGGISGTGDVVKNGTGTFNLNSISPFTGGLAINVGTVAFSAATDLGDTCPVTVAAGAVLNLGSSFETVGSLAGGGNVTNASSFNFNGNNTSTTYSGNMSGTGAATKQGTGTWTLNGNVGVAGTFTIAAGTVLLGNVNAIGDSTPVSITAGAVLNFNNTAENLGTLSGDGNITNNAGLQTDVTTAATYTGNIGGTGDVTKTGAATWTYDGSYQGGTLNIDEGTVILGAAGDIADLFINTGAVFNLNSTFEALGFLSGRGNVINNSNASNLGVGYTNQNATYTGIISGTSGITKGGTGRQALGGASTYAGGTIVEEGALLANNGAGSATGTGPVTVQAGGILGGDGLVSGAVTVQSGGQIAPGGSASSLIDAGGLAIGSNCTFQAGSTFAVQIGGGTPGTQHDQLIVAGTATLTGTLDVDLIGGFVPAFNQTFTVLTAGARSGTFAAFVAPPHFTVSYAGTNVILTYTGCPGDADGTNSVTQDDIDIVLFNFGSAVPPGTNGDLDLDGDVDQDDIDLVLFYFGTSCP